MKMYSTQEAADFLHVSLRTFKYWIKKFGVQAVQILAKGAKFYSGVQLENLRSATCANCTAEISGVQSLEVQNDLCKDKNCTPAPVQKPMTPVQPVSPVQKETKNLAKDLNDILQEKGNAGVAAEMKKMLADFDEEKEKAAVDAAQAERKAAEKAAAEKENFTKFIKDAEQIAEIEKLINSPPTPDRDKRLVEIILANLQWKYNKAGKPIYPLRSAINFERLLKCDPAISDLFAFEEFSEKIVMTRQAFWAKSPHVNTEWKNEDDAQLRTYIRKNYADLNSAETLADEMIVLAQSKSFHVVKNYFDSLPNWDKKPRAESLFIDFLKVPDTKFARVVTMQWLLAAVARIFYPGCNFQAALVLQGNQNIGKSYILERLGGAWYGCLSESVEKTDAIDAIRNFWICEIKELAAARRAEINAVKSFIERAADTYRVKYARRNQTFERHCVFAITCNDRQFLRDQTGNRRYWILESPLAEFCYIEGLTDEYIQQLWAEVYYKFKQLTANGFTDKILELPKEIKIQAEQIASGFTVNDGLKAEIAAFLDIPILPPTVWNILTLPEKRKYFVEGNNITIEQSVINRRLKNLSAKRKAEIENYTDSKEYVEEVTLKFTESKAYRFFGSYIRQETCASEILNELPTANDKRKTISRINEVLGLLDDWKKAEKDKKDFNGYGHQPNRYCRVVPAESDSADD